MNDIFKTLQYQGRILEQLGVNRFSTSTETSLPATIVRQGYFGFLSGFAISPWELITFFTTIYVICLAIFLHCCPTKAQTYVSCWNACLVVRRHAEPIYRARHTDEDNLSKEMNNPPALLPQRQSTPTDTTPIIVTPTTSPVLKSQDTSMSDSETSANHTSDESQKPLRRQKKVSFSATSPSPIKNSTSSKPTEHSLNSFHTANNTINITNSSDSHYLSTNNLIP